MLFIGTYFGELNVYKLEDQSLSLVKQWKFKSQITSVAAFNFRNDRLEQVACLFEHQAYNERSAQKEKKPVLEKSMETSLRMTNSSAKKDTQTRLKAKSAMELKIVDELEMGGPENDTLLAVSLAKGAICLMSFNMTTQTTPVESQGSLDTEREKGIQPGGAANRAKQPKMVEKNLIEHPSIISLPALNSKINKSAKPHLVKGS